MKKILALSFILLGFFCCTFISVGATLGNDSFIENLNDCQSNSIKAIIELDYKPLNNITLGNIILKIIQIMI